MGFYAALGHIVGLGPWPLAGWWALPAGWVFWALLLAGALPAYRRWAAALGGAATPGRPTPPPRPDSTPGEGPGTPLGTAAGGREVRLPVAELGTHALILGATGSGKTNALLLLAESAIARGEPVVVVDGKGSAELLRQVRAAAGRAGRGCAAFTFAGEAHWNPLKHGDPTRRRDLLSAAQDWNQPYYQAIAETYLGVAAQALEAVGEPTTLGSITRLITPDLRALEGVIRRIPDADLARRLFARVDRADESARSGIIGLASRLSRLVDSRIGPWLEPPGPGGTEIDLLATATNPGGPVVHFSLDTLGYPATAAPLAAMLLQDLQYVASELMTRGNTAPVSVLIDEFAPFDTRQLLGLLGRAREAGMGCVLATQDLADLERSGGRTAVDQVLANTGVKLALRCDVRETAERLAATLGTRPAWRTTQRTGPGASGGTARAEEVPLLQPSVLLQLRPGEAVLIRKHPEPSLEHLRLHLAGRSG